VKTEDAEKIYGGDGSTVQSSRLFADNAERASNSKPSGCVIMKGGERLWLKEVPPERDTLGIHDQQTRVCLRMIS
jgi:hypothetical protein